jgi:D-glycero-D-manno-heptose 1,7-bisphosphate phosphatase
MNIANANKAVFLDRDGILILERGDYSWLLEHCVLVDGITEPLLEFQQKGYLLIVISNQGGIGKGLYSKADADYLHLHLKRVLLSRGIELTDIYYCPHHPTETQCICRKPDSLLLEKAMARYNIDPAKSYFIGDAIRDEEAGVKAGVKPIRIAANSSVSAALSIVK